MNEKKKTVVSLQDGIEELNDALLSQVNGGTEKRELPRNANPTGLKLGQALKKNTSFTKSDDQLPSDN